MAFRYILITKPSKLSVRNNNIQIQQEELTTIPLEDINAIVIDEKQVSLSAPLLSQCMQDDVALFFCNDQHLPIGVSLPFQSHSKQHHRIGEQLTMGKPFQKRIWQKLIIQKIYNQSKVLQIRDIDLGDYLEKLSKQVDSGDTKNVEGRAAKLYFKELFGKDFIRHREDGINIALDYGYSILRGIIARTIVGYGLIPSLGIKHANQYNNFNLADDFIEPFRPIVDLYVSYKVKQDTTLNTILKACLIDLMNFEVLINGQKITVTNAIDATVKSFISSLRDENYSKIVLPEIIKLSRHDYE